MANLRISLALVLTAGVAANHPGTAHVYNGTCHSGTCLAGKVQPAASMLQFTSLSSESKQKRQVIKANSALLVIDVQDCFVEGGTLAVNGGKALAPVINKLHDSGCFDEVVFSQDYHPAGHISFGSSNGIPDFPVGAPIPMKCMKPASGDINDADAACCPDTAKISDADVKRKVDAAVQSWTGNKACQACFDGATSASCFELMQSMWPDHCLQTGDSGLLKDLTKTDADTVIQKGTNKWVDAYSAFMDNTKNLKTALGKTLKDKGIEHVYVVGIALDFCVAWSANDARELGFDVTVIEDATAGIDIDFDGDGTPDSIANAKKEMVGKGVAIIKSTDVKCEKSSSSR